MNRLLEQQTWKETAVHSAPRKMCLRSIKENLPGLGEQTHKNMQLWEVQLQNMLLPQKLGRTKPAYEYFEFMTQNEQ